MQPLICGSLKSPILYTLYLKEIFLYALLCGMVVEPIFKIDTISIPVFDIVDQAILFIYML